MELPNGRESDRFNQLLDTVCTDLSTDGLKRLHAFCVDAKLFSHEHLGNLSTSALLSELNRFGLVNRDNVQLLKFIARACRQHALLDVIKQFEKTRPLLPLPANFEKWDCTSRMLSS